MIIEERLAELSDLCALKNVPREARKSSRKLAAHMLNLAPHLLKVGGGGGGGGARLGRRSGRRRLCVRVRVSESTVRCAPVPMYGKGESQRARAGGGDARLGGR